ncbi:hypothetical protein PtrSN002B_007270 [Pyrenophora tritici-repentis]|nr:hypothetical protein A1F99_046440 [Pyrenophora tritici-repentis]KAF7572593.1 hypothetical protein PtrM4_074980 [Pyrenophora tritici-repentis]KAG9376003.1 hypothetical protein A1F94_013269 [Pyrenophora tritici-repentis]KAI0583747.1 hypothetical protein Alg215_03475 [Pyrenophora tritici-repentis]KAI0620565.1 hypothetical protein TUN199_07441 [Pyrenophora tritici-repentis]
MNNIIDSSDKSRTLRGYAVPRGLHRRSEELDDAVHDDEADFDERFSWEKSSMEFEPGTEDLDTGVEDSRAWLEELAVKEERKGSLLIADMGKWACETYQREILQMRTVKPGMNTTILDQIRKGEYPHEKKVEDLLAPLRVQELPPGTEESQKDMIKVTLDWNKRVSRQEENAEARQDFIAALKERTKAVDKVLAIVGDETNIDQFDRVGQSGILEPSQCGLLRAIHVYRPETRTFKHQNPFDMLLLMWAHLQNPDLTVEDDWIYLSYKVLNGEEELEIRFEREEQERRFQEMREEAMRQGDQVGLILCTKRWKAYNRKIAETARQNTISKIRYICGEVRKMELDGLLGLSILQSAQQCAARNVLPKDRIPPWTQMLDKCDKADEGLDEKFEKCFPDLEAVSEVTSNRVREMATTHDMVLTRTLKFAGADLVGMDDAAKEHVIQARLTDPVTAGLMKQTLFDVLEMQVVAAQMLRHVRVMDDSLNELLKATKAKCEEVEKLTLVADYDERVESGYVEEMEGVDIEEAEFA